MKTAAIIPVKTFSEAKSRLNISPKKKIELCQIMLKEIMDVLSISPRIDKIVSVTKDEDAIKISKEVGATVIIDKEESGVNNAVAKADAYLLQNHYDASIVFPQDIPLIKTQDIDFLFKFQSPPNFAVIVPSKRFDGTNCLLRMPVDLMKTHYDEDSYRIHMKVAQEKTRNASLVFVRRIMTDVDTDNDLKYLIKNNEEKPNIVNRIKELTYS